MKRRELTPTWIVDYSAARAHAIRWLGDRYLLARPLNAVRYGLGKPTPGIALRVSADRTTWAPPAATSEALPLTSLARGS